MTNIIPSDAILRFPVLLSKKKDGTPISAATKKHINCLFVMLNMTFDFTLVKSLGTEI